MIAPPVEIDALVIDELIRSGFLPARDFHQRSEIAEAAAQAFGYGRPIGDTSKATLFSRCHFGVSLCSAFTEVQ